MSKTRKITASKKNRMENGRRADLLGSNPHSKGDVFSRSLEERAEAREIIVNRMRGTSREIEDEIKNIIITGAGIGVVRPCLTSSELSVLPAQCQINSAVGKIANRDTSERGRNVFHVRAINISYRMRGRVPRVHKKINAIVVVMVIKKISFRRGFRGVDMNRTVVIRLIIRIFMYSAIKISANAPPLYSVLKPDTNSDSPSAKSKGVRLVSASVVVNQISIRGGAMIKIGVSRWYRLNIFRECMRMRGDRRTRAILTSYEMVCAALRRAPSRAYFEFDDHPAIRVV